MNEDLIMNDKKFTISKAQFYLTEGFLTERGIRHFFKYATPKQIKDNKAKGGGLATTGCEELVTKALGQYPYSDDHEETVITFKTNDMTVTILVE